MLLSQLLVKMADSNWDLGPIFEVGLMVGTGAAASYLFDGISVSQGIEQFAMSGMLGSYLSKITPIGENVEIDELIEKYADNPYWGPIRMGLISAGTQMSGGLAYELLTTADVSMKFLGSVAGLGGLLLGVGLSAAGRIKGYGRGW